MDRQEVPPGGSRSAARGTVARAVLHVYRVLRIIEPHLWHAAVPHPVPNRIPLYGLALDRSTVRRRQRRPEDAGSERRLDLSAQLMSQSSRRRVEISRRSFLGALGSGLAVAGGACAARRGAGVASSPTGSVSSAEVLRLGANENPYGPAPAALRAIGDALPEANRYAFSAMSDTAAALAEHLHVPASH